MKRNLFEYYPVIGYRFIPGIKARISHEGGGYLVRCNQAGFRCDHEVTTIKPPGVFRIVLFGCSYTAGDGVSNRYRFGDLLESLFPSTEVLNFGLPGSGTDQQYLTFLEFARGISYDLLLICPLVENIRRNVARYRLILSAVEGRTVLLPKPYFLLEDGQLVLYHSPVPGNVLRQDEFSLGNQEHVDRGGRFPALRKFIKKRLPGLQDPIQRLVRYQPLPEYDDPQHPAWLLMKAILSKWIQESSADALICPIPLYQYVEQSAKADGYRQRFSELPDELDVEVVDLIPRFLRESPEIRRKCRFSNDQHPTPLEHAIIADGLAPYIEKYYLRWKDNNE